MGYQASKETKINRKIKFHLLQYLHITILVYLAIKVYSTVYDTFNLSLITFYAKTKKLIIIFKKEG